jgi:hypothetical protein
MEETLEEGLGRIFGARTAAADRPADGAPAEAADGAEPAVAAAPGAEPEAPDRPATADLAGRARDHYDRALAAQRAGDWARYGEEIRQLGEVLEEMAAAGETGRP